MLRLLTAGSVEEQVCKAAADKRALADRCITGGFFDGQTGAQERQTYLLSLIRPTDPAAARCASFILQHGTEIVCGTHADQVAP